MLEIRDLTAGYGPIQVLRGVSLSLQPGEVVAVLGTNGAGKSTLLRTISGLVRARSGSIRYHGREISHLSTDAIVRQGIVHVPEGRRIFTQMTVLENLMMGAFTHKDPKTIYRDLEFVFVLFPDLAEKQTQWGGELSGGQQQMLAIGRALMSRPTVLLMDEPSLGLSPILVEELGALSHALADLLEERGMSILLVEQNVGLAIQMASRAYIMETGRVTWSGSTEDISIESIRQRYLATGARER